MDIEQVTDAYIRLRDKYDALEEQKKELKGHMAALETAADALLGSAQSVKTDAGTAYRKRTMRAKVTDRDAWFEYVAETGLWNFLTTHVATAEVQAHMDMTVGVPPPPGLDLSEVLSINFRRA